MVNYLRRLLHANVAAPPHEDDDLARVLALRVRRRLAAVVTGSALGIALVVAGAVAIPRLSHHGRSPCIARRSCMPRTPYPPRRARTTG